MTVVVVWGLNFPATKILRNELSTLQVLGLRWPAFAALLLVVTLIVEKRRRVSGRDFLALALIAVPGIVLNQMMWVHGLGATTASRSALILATGPIFANLFTPLFGGRPLGSIGWLGIILALGGICLVMTGPSLAGPVPALLRRVYDDIFYSPASFGDLLQLGAAASIGFFTAASRPYVRKYSPLLFVTYTVCIGAVLMVPFVVKPLSHLDFAHVSLKAWGWLAYTTVGAGVFGFICWFNGVAKIGPARTAVYQTVIPVAAVAAAVPLLHDALTPIQLLGGALTLGGVFIARMDEGKKGQQSCARNEPQ